ncbi:MAG: glycosyltransferase [Solirubrobacterales bacterium]
MRAVIPAEGSEKRPRLLVYVDAPFRAGPEGRLYTNSEAFPFMSFVAEVGAGFAHLHVLGRAASPDAGADYELPPGPTLLPLPYYVSLRRLLSVAGSAAGTLRAMWRGLSQVDVVWVFGPHPLSLLLALLALVRRRRVILGVRQDTMRYFRARLPGNAWAPLLVPLWLLDRAFHLLARAVSTIVVGSELERAYGGPRPGLVSATISLASTADVLERAPEQTADGARRLLTVGRVEPEKNPLLVVEMLAELNRRRPGFSLLWAGTGRMSAEVLDLAARRGVADRIELPGFVPYGPELISLYRDADMFVHVSLTEGSPQVLVEAMAAGTPVVATNVGSVAATLEEGRAGLLVPPNDVDALVEAVIAFADDPERRRRCVERGLELARGFARDAEAARLAQFISGRPQADSG